MLQEEEKTAETELGRLQKEKESGAYNEGQSNGLQWR